MANLVQATVDIKGTRPLIWNAFGPEAIPLEPHERTGVAGNNPEEWKTTVLYDRTTRQLYVYPSYIFGMVRGGAKHIKSGRLSIQSKVAATLQVQDWRIDIDRYLPPEEELTTDPTQLVYLDISAVVNPQTHRRNIRYRIAASAGWRATFHLLWDKTVVSRSEMEGAIYSAGALVGLGDGRVLGYGRFEILAFEVQDDAQKTAAS